MFSHTITLAILTHPLHVLLFGVILSRLAREVVSAAARAREGSRGDRLPVAPDPSNLRAA